ncbi:MAG TPA: LysR family transcriptional regulator, partial [Xanthobacteraceae bacterium]
MDTILNMKAFLATARSGSFSEAARQLSVAPSVVSKRVNQLEWQLRARLLERTTRRVRLTEVGEQYLPTVRGIVTEYDDLVTGIQRSPGELEGHIRVKSPAALTNLHLGRVFTAFQRAN